MRNPIFAADTLFQDQSPDGITRHLGTDRSVELSCGGRIVLLNEKQPLIEVKTVAGRTLTMSPETAFSLASNDDGKLIRYSPVELSTPSIDWQADLDDIEERRFALVGMICSSGLHIINRYRTSYLITTDADLAANVTQFLQRMGDHMVEAKMIHLNANSVTVKFPTHDSYFIRSRILTTLVNGLLQEHTQRIAFLPSSISRRNLKAFFYGLLSTASRVDDAIVIKHRVSATIRTIAEHLMFDFGVPCDIHIHPMEPEVQRDVTRPEGHRLRLSADQIDYAVAAGLLDGVAKDISFYGTDSISTVTPLENRVSSVIITPGAPRDFPLTANSFVFNSEFAMPMGIVEIATHPSVLTDSSDPTKF